VIIAMDQDKINAILLKGDDSWAQVTNFQVGEAIFVGSGDNQPYEPWFRAENEHGSILYGPLSSLTAIGVGKE